MTPIEMQRNFLSELGLSENTERVPSNEIFYFLNKSQDQFVKDLYRQGFELDQAISDRLRVFLVKDKVLQTIFAGEYSGIDNFVVDYIELPDNYLHLISQRSKTHYNPQGIEYTLVNNSRVENNAIKSGIHFNRYSQSDDIYQLLSDPFNKTKHDKPISDINNNKLNIYTDDTFIVSDVIINYLRQPKEISLEQSCEIPKTFHEEIIEQAVGLFARSSQPSNSQDDKEN